MKKVISIAVAVLLAALSAMPVLAAEVVKSPKATTANFIITIDTPDIEGGTAVAEYKTEVGEDGKQTVVITATPYDNYDFIGWEISGDYSPNGQLTDRVLELVAASDLKVKPKFQKKGDVQTTNASATSAAGSVEKVVDNSTKSPQTGSDDYAAYLVLFGAVIILGSVVYRCAKSRSDK